jgi:hypothetical protein
MLENEQHRQPTDYISSPMPRFVRSASLVRKDNRSPDRCGFRCMPDCGPPAALQNGRIASLTVASFRWPRTRRNRPGADARPAPRTRPRPILPPSASRSASACRRTPSSNLVRPANDGFGAVFQDTDPNISTRQADFDIIALLPVAFADSLSSLDPDRLSEYHRGQARLFRDRVGRASTTAGPVMKALVARTANFLAAQLEIGVASVYRVLSAARRSLDLAPPCAQHSGRGCILLAFALFERQADPRLGRDDGRSLQVALRKARALEAERLREARCQSADLAFTSPFVNAR